MATKRKPKAKVIYTEPVVGLGKYRVFADVNVTKIENAGAIPVLYLLTIKAFDEADHGLEQTIILDSHSDHDAVRDAIGIIDKLDIVQMMEDEND